MTHVHHHYTFSLSHLARYLICNTCLCVVRLEVAYVVNMLQGHSQFHAVIVLM